MMGKISSKIDLSFFTTVHKVPIASAEPIMADRIKPFNAMSV
jgi:hypothetical protein